jgi:outer membrane protein TolC
MTDLGPAAAEALRIARLLFEEGETSLLDLLDAQRTAREARREEIRARFELAVALSELQRLLGPDIPTGR